jgi:hypothetical protein
MRDRPLENIFGVTEMQRDPSRRVSWRTETWRDRPLESDLPDKDRSPEDLWSKEDVKI